MLPGQPDMSTTTSIRTPEATFDLIDPQIAPPGLMITRRPGSDQATAPACLPPEVILDVQSNGELNFIRMARVYPAEFVDVSIGRWEELTGEDD